MSIHLDKSPNSVVLTCTECPWWHGFAFDAVDADLRGANHEATVHPEDTAFRRQSGKNRRNRDKRHASGAPSIPLMPH